MESAVCAEIGAAQQVTSAVASNQLLVATSLRRAQTRSRSRGVDIDVDDASCIATLWDELFVHSARPPTRHRPSD